MPTKPIWDKNPILICAIYLGPGKAAKAKKKGAFKREVKTKKTHAKNK